ncbi:serine--tRNA ligase, mitochondrial [Anopheles aquasalis]|uniref:serine--tRNA ligase, mitochondrial n=1 Tax=Anopheles aquasalis TaxID=42839 RepID=UPI00215A63A6|nr:serine--tRNA ligase, mitochondrial [Anopheles aquasalis]
MLPKCMGRMLLFLVTRRPLFSHPSRRMSYHRFDLQQPTYNTDYLLDPANADEIEGNIRLRKGVGDIRLVHELQQRLQEAATDESRRQLADRLQTELGKLPNQTHPRLLSYEGKPRLVRRYNEPHVDRASTDNRPHYEFGDICKRMNLYRMESLGNFTGHRSYYLLDELAELEHALIGYTVERLLQEQFRLISVLDLLPARIIESCGMSTTGTRNQVYKVTGQQDALRDDTLCLSGTSEMALAGYFAGRVLPADRLPLRLAAVSRCYRAETSALHEEKGIYRVHQFTKVEMFAICAPHQSASVLRQFRDIEVSLFERLGLPFVVLDMPACELGAPAYRKYDIEAWMPGRQMYGEISSCSDCTDYQARRLGIRVDRAQQQPLYAHTVNGTACAIPRMLIALLENFQNEDYTVSIPEPLQRHMHGKKVLRRRKVLPELKLTKRLQQEELACTV